MIGNGMKVAALIVAIVLVTAGLTLVLMNKKPVPSDAEMMVLRPSDLNGNWSVEEEFVPQPWQNTSSSYGVALHNGSLTLWSRIDVFNSSQDCNSSYLALRSQFNVSHMKEVQIGEKGFQFENGDMLIVYFVEKSTLAVISTNSIYPYDFSPFPWQENATMDFVLIQFSKVANHFD